MTDGNGIMTGKMKPIRIPTLHEFKKRGRKITVLTAYDATMAGLLDRAGVDVLLVGDSLGMVIMGESSTLSVTMDVMVHHTRAVVRGTKQALVVADLPFLSYQITPEEALRNAGRLVQEAGAAAVKLEGGRHPEVIRRMVDAGIPVMSHIGLTPQFINQFGGYVMQGGDAASAQRLMEEARTVAAAGAFALVLECIPHALAGAITAELAIPTIGIGAGPDCDGQVLVSYDAFGLFDKFVPSFVKRYACLGDAMKEAAREYVREVQSGTFPARGEE
jgi:3-methyl-2-oxobutanoate hydroxymethyltransferase